MSRRIVRYEPGTTLRYCDECGARYRATELVQGSDKLFRCRQFCVERTMIDVDRAAASVHRQREAPPPPFGQNFGLNDTWMSEVNVFELVVNWAPEPAVSIALNAPASHDWSATRVHCAGEALVYLYGILSENKRPRAWLTAARTKMRALADYLLSGQNVADATFAGSYSYNSALSAVFLFDEARAALGMLRAYQLIGKPEYLASAKACARFLVNYQAIDKLIANYTVAAPGSTSPWLFGAMPQLVLLTGAPWQGMYPHTSFGALEFFKELQAVDGDGLYGDNNSGLYTTNPAKLLSLAQTQIRAFWSTAQWDYAVSAAVLGFSSTSLYSLWVPSMAGAPASYWSGNTSYRGQNMAWALRSLQAYEGASAQCLDVFNYFMAYVSNPAFATNLPAYEPAVAESTSGTFNPRYGLSIFMQAATLTPGTPAYIPSTAGNMAALLDKTSLDYAKLHAGETALIDASNGNLGTSVPAYYYTTGLSWQMYGQLSVSVIDAAMFGNVYRYSQFYGGTN